jgi:hypothetical protein
MKQLILAVYLSTISPAWGQDLSTQEWEDMSLIIETEHPEIQEFYVDDFKNDPNPYLPSTPELEPLFPTKVEPMFEIITVPSSEIE